MNAMTDALWSSMCVHVLLVLGVACEQSSLGAGTDGCGCGDLLRAVKQMKGNWYFSCLDM